MIFAGKKAAKKAPNPVDKHVGSRVRMRRKMLNMSQEHLGDRLGITFQQVQKYENGTNRISASRLQQAARILQVPIPFFFDGAPGRPNPDGSPPARPDVRTPRVGGRHRGVLVRHFGKGGLYPSASVPPRDRRPWSSWAPGGAPRSRAGRRGGDREKSLMPSIHRNRGKFPPHFKGQFGIEIRKFESSRPSQPVRRQWGKSQLQEYKSQLQE